MRVSLINVYNKLQRCFVFSGLNILDYIFWKPIFRISHLYYYLISDYLGLERRSVLDFWSVRILVLKCHVHLFF